MVPDKVVEKLPFEELWVHIDAPAAKFFQMSQYLVQRQPIKKVDQVLLVSEEMITVLA